MRSCTIASCCSWFSLFSNICLSCVCVRACMRDSACHLYDVLMFVDLFSCCFSLAFFFLRSFFSLHFPLISFSCFVFITLVVYLVFIAVMILLCNAWSPLKYTSFTQSFAYIFRKLFYLLPSPYLSLSRSLVLIIFHHFCQLAYSEYTPCSLPYILYCIAFKGSTLNLFVFA